MNIQPWDPWQELQRLRETTDRLWDEFLARLRHTHPERRQLAFLPPVDLVETQQDYRVYLSLPGLLEEDIDLDVQEDVLVVRGERERPYDPRRAEGRVCESRYGAFERQIRLPQKVDVSTMQVCYDAGVLTIIVSKSSASRSAS
ncbi:MAG: Hsp20/alpha crystallin family protein [Pirellulaceae bacterium]|nr:Hsp20/alpha crystallin family protein [Pirellulaceae bacterium]